MNNKKIGLFILIGLFSISFVIAGIFILNTFDFSFTVQEPLSIEYAWEEFPYACDNANYSIYSGAVDPGRIIYPGNNEKICFKINSLSNGLIPLFVNYTAGANVDTFELFFPTNVRSGDNYGSVNFTIAGDADGVSAGSIVFGRGN